ncbi:MAG: hypothetical protein LRZ85_01140 [Alphaproteobacteria bacterium]|nr:hypothetical protein [Alphaproteobacteria bacterium]
MTSDQTLPQETKPDNTANFNGVNFLGQEIAEVEGRQKDLSEWLSRIEKAPNPHTIPSANAADKSGKIIGSFAGADSRFVEKDDVPELRKSSILLSIMVGLGTTAFTKYLILGSLTTSATISLSLISGVAAMAGFLYFFDRGLMQTLDRVKLQKSQEYKNFVSTLEADWKNFTTKIGKADAMGTLQSAAFGAGNAWANILMMGRLIIIGGSTAYLATAAADTFLVGSEVNADLQAQFDASQSVVDPNDGITTRPEVIADIKADSAEYSARISELETEKLALQKQLAGYELTPGEQQRLDVLNGQIAKLEAEKLAAEAKVAQFSAEMTKEAKGAAGAVEGEGPLWRKAKANLEYHERIAETKTTALTTAESQKKALIEGAQDRANSLRDDQFVTSNRARVTEIDQEINGLNAKITERADPEAFARKEGIWPEFNPEGNKRFMPVWEKVIEGGPQTMIISGMVITGAFIAEALAYLEKRGGELSKPVLKKSKI